MNILRIKEILQDKSVSGKDLAQKLGVSQNTISNIVNGKNFPKPGLLVAIANELDVDIRELFVSTKSKDLSDPTVAINEIRKIVEGVKDVSGK